MSSIAARDARTVVALVEEVVAIHLIALCQALELRGLDHAAGATRQVHELVRERVPFVSDDRAMDGDIQSVLGLIRDGQLNDLITTLTSPTRSRAI
ncbi:MAG: aromatic amino acid lyase [Pseudonocardiaceae bacterium]